LSRHKPAPAVDDVTAPKTRKKLIEVALPLEAINKAAAREKSIRHGHPSTLHMWWARRPLAAARAVIFSQMVDDPSSWPELFPTPAKQEKERQLAALQPAHSRNRSTFSPTDTTAVRVCQAARIRGWPWKA